MAVTGIKFDTSSITIGQEDNQTLTATFLPVNTAGGYYVVLKGKKYPISKVNDKVEIGKTEIITDGSSTRVISDVETSDSSVATAEKVGTDGVKITGVAGGTASITVKYSESIKTTITVIVRAKYTITVEVADGEDSHGTVTGGGTFLEDTVIQISSNAATGYAFDKWTIGENDYVAGDTATGINVDEDGVLTYTVTEGKKITATFKIVPTPSSPFQSYVGYYAYVDGIWGIIYADLQKEEPNNSPWGNSDGEYTLQTLGQNESYKTYIVSALPASNGPVIFGGSSGLYSNTGVLSLAADSTGNKDRFLVMETTDRESMVSWTSVSTFTAGINNSWILPNKEQLSIFGSAFGITNLNYSDTYELGHFYWSSTEYNYANQWGANFMGGRMLANGKSNSGYVRLCTTY